MDNNASIDNDEEELRRINSFISNMISSITKGINESGKSATPYAFNIRIDKEGTPIIEEIKNSTKEHIHIQKPQEPAPAIAQQKPLYELIDNQKSITLIYECRGFNKKN